MFLTGYDEDTLTRLKRNHKFVVTIEDGIVFGGFGSRIAQYYGMSDVKVLNCGFSLDIPTAFSRNEMIEANGLRPEQIVDKILRAISS